MNYLETVKCTKSVIVNSIDNISAKVNNGIMSAVYTSRGLSINGSYYWFEEVTKEGGGTETVMNVIPWGESRVFTWVELNTLYGILNIQYPTNPTYEQRVKSDIKAGLLYVTQQDGKFGTTANDWVAA